LQNDAGFFGFADFYFLCFCLVVVVEVLCAQVLSAFGFLVLFWVWVVDLGLFGCCSGCDEIYSMFEEGGFSVI